MKIIKFSSFIGIIIFSFGLVACQSEIMPEPASSTIETSEIDIETPFPTAIGTDAVDIEEPLIPNYPETLVVCLGQEPETLYLYGEDSQAKTSILESIYDGPIDSRNFNYQPVILEKLPTLADGDAIITAVTVSEGDMVLVNGTPEILSAGMVVQESGCQSDACATEYIGGEIVMDQLSATFTIIPELTWSDGVPLTTADSVFSFNINAEPATPARKFTSERTASYSAIDESVLVWTGIPGYMDATFFLNFWTPLPQHLLGNLSAIDLVEAKQANLTPVGWGPYVIQEWLPGISITLVKNENYFRGSEGLPYFETLVYRFVGVDSSINVKAILTRECDVVDQTSELFDQAKLILEFENEGDLNTSFSTGTEFEHIDFGINPVSYDNGYDVTEGDRPDFFGDVRTRQAIALCLDRQTVIDTVFFGKTELLHSYLSSDHPLYNSDVAKYPYDIEAGSALLEDIGWVLEEGETVRVASGIEGIEDGTQLSFNYSTSNLPERKQSSQLIAESAASCGIELILDYWKKNEFISVGPSGPLFGRQFDVGQFAWLTGLAPPCDLWTSEGIAGDENLTIGEIDWLSKVLVDVDPTKFSFPFGWGGWNNSGYANSNFDNVCQAALQSIPRQSAYRENHLRAQEIFASTVPIIPLYPLVKLAITRPDFCGFSIAQTAKSEMWNIEEFAFGSLCD